MYPRTRLKKNCPKPPPPAGGIPLIPWDPFGIRGNKNNNSASPDKGRFGGVSPSCESIHGDALSAGPGRSNRQVAQSSRVLDAECAEVRPT